LPGYYRGFVARQQDEGTLTLSCSLGVFSVGPRFLLQMPQNVAHCTTSTAVIRALPTTSNSAGDRQCRRVVVLGPGMSEPASSERLESKLPQVGVEYGPRVLVGRVFCGCHWSPVRWRSIRRRAIGLNISSSTPIPAKKFPTRTSSRATCSDRETFVEVSKEELQEMALESTRTIEIDEFVEKSEINPRYLIRPYYLCPGGKVGHDALP